MFGAFVAVDEALRREIRPTRNFEKALDFRRFLSNFKLFPGWKCWYLAQKRFFEYQLNGISQSQVVMVTLTVLTLERLFRTYF